VLSAPPEARVEAAVPEHPDAEEADADPPPPASITAAAKATACNRFLMSMTAPISRYRLHCDDGTTLSRSRV